MSGIALLSFSLLILIVAAANPRVGFSIGTGTKTEDIVKDGVTQPAYASQAAPFAVPSGNFLLTWFTHINTSTNGNNPTAQPYNISWVTSPPPVDQAIYVLSGTGLNQTITVGFPDRTDFTFTCNTVGIAWSTITITVPPFDDIVVYVQHLCKPPHTFNMGLVKFDVGQTNAILDGIPHETFFYEAATGDDFTQFFAWLTNGDEPPQQYNVTVDFTTPGLQVDITTMVYPLWTAFDQFDTSSPVSSFQLFYECPLGAHTIQINVNVFTGWHDKLKFQITKMCNKPLLVNPGFMVGFEKNGSEVVSGSITQAAFSQTTPWTYLAGDISQTFWLWLDAKLSPVLTLDYVIQVTQTDGFSLGGTGFSGTVKVPAEGPERDTVVQLQLLCLKDTNVSYSVIITFADATFAPVNLYFSKRCADPQLDVGQYVVTQQGTLLLPTLVHKNVANPNTTFVDHDLEHSAFYIWIPKSYSAITPYQQFAITSFHFDINFMDATMRVMKGDKARTSTSPAGTPYILVQYRCVTPPDVSVSTLNISINIGWQQDIQFSWVKRCDSSVAPTPGDDGGSSSAWTPFGIFAFTVFILILVWCLVGCGYNYVAKDQRGADAIPGINLYRSIYYKCFPSPKYTPQTDYNYSERDTPDYGGTSYQSENL